MKGIPWPTKHLRSMLVDFLLHRPVYGYYQVYGLVKFSMNLFPPVTL